MNRTIKTIAIIAVCLMFCFQLISMALFSGEQIEDSADYKENALRKVASNSFYPDETNEYDKFMANPGLINYLILFYRFGSSDKVLIAANIILVAIMAACVYFIAWKLFKNKTIAWLSLLLLAVFPAFAGEILNLRSEILFTTIAYSAIAIFLSDIRFKYILSGMLLAVANWVRPLGLVFLLSILIYMLMTKVRFINYVKLLSSVLAVVMILASVTYISSGYFDFQSVTGGVNLIMGANDDADGSYNQTVFLTGNIGHLENYDQLTYKEKDSAWINRSVEWILQNPGKYIGLIPSKLYYMYAVDTYAFSTFYNNEVITSGSDYISSLADNAVHFRFNRMTWVDFVVILNQLVYMLYLALTLLALIILLIKKTRAKEVIFMMAILILGTGMTVMTVGGARYHYPYLPVMFILASALSYQFLSKKRSNKTNSEQFLKDKGKPTD